MRVRALRERPCGRVDEPAKNDFPAGRPAGAHDRRLFFGLGGVGRFLGPLPVVVRGHDRDGLLPDPRHGVVGLSALCADPAAVAGDERAAALNNSVYNLFVAVGVELARSEVRTEPERRDRAWAIVCRFWLLLGRHSACERSVGFYANALHITSDYLNKVCRRTCGASPKSMIDQQLAVEIKSLLADTQMTVAEIAGRLHFEDASYMCRYFRRMTGMSPIEFRSGSVRRSGGRADRASAGFLPPVSGTRLSGER